MTKKIKPWTTLALGGLFFLIPVILFIVVFTKAVNLIRPLGKSLAEYLQIEGTFKIFMIDLICIGIIILLCIIAGFLLRKGFVKNWSGDFEEKLFFLIPGLQRVKFSLMGDSGRYTDKVWQPIIFEDGDHYRIGVITDDSDPVYVALYIPDTPRLDTGEVRYYTKKELRYHKIRMKKLINSQAHFGRGLKISQITGGRRKKVNR